MARKEIKGEIDLDRKIERFSEETKGREKNNDL